MTRRLLFLACALLTMLGNVHVVAQTKASASTASTSSTEQDKFVEGVVRVKLQREVASRIVSAKLPMSVSGTKQTYVTTGVTPFDKVSQKVKAVTLKRTFPYAGKDEAKHVAAGLDLWYDVYFEGSGMTPAYVRNLYRSAQGVTYAQRVPKYKISDSNRFIQVSPEAVAKAAKAASTMPFNDPLLSKQWHYNNDGSVGQECEAGNDINLFKAWQETGVYGSKDVVVAIIDGGFDYSHVDLKDNVWINEAELNGQAGVDDDGDGYVDDIYGYNFVTNSADLSSHNHGTHVAGTVGATNGNGVGVCGVAGGKDGTGGVKMMVCQVFDSRSTSSGDFANALIYAADRGASIAQCSWGMSVADEEDTSITEAVKYFTKNGGGNKMKGGLCIFAAGNNGEEGEYFPGCLDDVVAVGALTSDGTAASYSNYGTWVDVSAPGGLKDYGEQYAVLSTQPGDTYGYMEGTSMACPHVSGIAALILSKYGNKDFSNETLRTLLTTSVNDIYTKNPNYEGKMGTGAIDAYKALNVGSSTSKPESVTDFTLSPSHNTITLNWVIPECEDKSVDHHVLYYSTESFDKTTDVSTLNSVSIDTKFKNCGDTMTYELTGLSATTTYYVALVAYNRWGNASAMSEVKTATTNAGPKVKLSKTSASMTVDASKSSQASTTFDITNAGEGTLKYNLTAGVKSATVSNYSKNAPTPGQIVPFSGKMSLFNVKSNPIATTDEYEKENWPDTLAYTKTAYCYLGESDTSLPNAMAQYFYVDPTNYPNGFNLTTLRVMGQNGKNPTIEIYSGSSSISTASLLETVTYSYWGYNYDISLPEQLYFQPKGSFWIVVKFPEGASNPLAAGKSTAGNIPQYSFYSSDNGTTWTQLTEVLKGTNFETVSSNLTWGILPLSKNPDWTTVLAAKPISGSIAAGEKQTVTLANDGQSMVNGTYKYNIHVNSNEAVDSKQTVALTMTVKGNTAKLKSPQLVDFGNLLLGQSKSIDVELTNVGYGPFGPSYSGKLTSSSSDFTGPSSVYNFAARSKKTVTITFKPTEAGDRSATITLKDKNNVEHSFIVRGVASVPATLDIPTSEYDLGELKVGGESKTQTFTLKNTGKYPLQYVFPKFSDETISGSTSKAHKYGYTAQSNVAGDTTFTYSAMPELSDEVDITNQFTNNNWQSGAIKVGFKFPFYGTDYEEVHVTSHGGIAMKTMSGNISCMVPTASCVSGLGYISGYGNSGKLEMGGNSKVSYGHKDGRLYVNFKNVLTSAGNDTTTPVSFHMVLCPDGSVEVHYDDYNPANVFGSGAYNFVGVSDIQASDYFVFYDADNIEYDSEGSLMPYSDIQTGSAIKIVAPAKSFITSLSSADGYINIGESKDITVTAAAGDDLVAGATTNYLTVLTNDPNRPSANITLKATITGDNLKPEAKLDSTSVDFGQVFQTSLQKRTISLANNGKDVLSVSSIAAKDGKFTVAEDVQSAFTIAAGQSKDIVITLPTTEKGAVEDVLVISYADGTSAEVALKGTVIGTPKWSISPASIEQTTPYGTNVTLSDVTVTNNGDEPMTFHADPADWYSPLDLTVEDNDTKQTVDYVFQSKSDGYDVPFKWEDITEDYTAHMPYAYYYETTDFKEVELPFEFPFYGKKYKKMYIYDTGFVSFDETTDYKQFPEPPSELPTTDVFYRNIICPFWGNHSMATTSTAGAYYKAEDDRVIVSFQNYGNSMMYGMDYQVIINKDGSFKFQYKLEDGGYMIGVFGLCGIQDHNGTRGITPSDMYITPGNALMFYPYKNYVVEAGKTASMPIELKADKLADTYNYELNVTTNDPQNTNVTVPVKLEVTGAANVVFPDSVNICTPVDEYLQDLPYYEFTVTNTGTKAVTISGVSCPLFSAEEFTTPEATLEVYTTQLASTGGDDDFGPLAVSDETTTKKWQTYSDQTITLGKDSLKFRVGLYNPYTVHKTTANMTFTVDGTEKEIPLVIDITDAPHLAFDANELRISNVAADYTGEHTITMSNQGDYKLTYSLRLDASGRDDADGVSASTSDGGYDDDLLSKVVKPTAETAKSFIETCAAKVSPKTMGLNKVKDSQKYVLDIPSKDFEYRTIYHPILNPVSSARATLIGSGTTLDENFLAATRYEAPADGFNLTHLYFTGSVGELENVDIEASVILGNDVTKTANTIGHGKIHVEKNDTASTFGTPRMLEFDNPIFINPNDTFYVVVKYPAGNGYSALMTSKDGEKETNRYMAKSTGLGGWVDIEEMYDSYYSYGAFGFVMTCVEKEAGESWIKLLDTTATSGEIAAGSSATVKVKVNAAHTYFDKDNKATLIVKSNDPSQKTVNYHIYLDRNAAPVITVPSGNITVQEGSEANATITVVDQEGDNFTADLSNLEGIASVESYTNAEGTTDGITVADGVYAVEGGTLNLNVLLAPDYGTAGSHTITVNTTDANNNSSSEKFTYNVEHTNRAPQFIGEKEITVKAGEMTGMYSYDGMFSDPDDDNIIGVSISNSDENVVQVFESTTGFILRGVAAGTAKISLSATDANYAVGKDTITVTVTDATGINGVEADGAAKDVTVDANTGNGDVNVTIGKDADNVTLRIFSNGGQLMAQKTLTNVHAGDKVALSLGAESGVFHLTADIDGAQTAVKFAKK